MKKILSIFLLSISILNATSLLTYNIYERSDRVDLMLSFDSPYDGKILKKQGKNIVTLILKDLSYDNLVEKNIDSKIVQAITIEPNENEINIIIKSKNRFSVVASKTVDGFGLRIRTKPIKENIARLPMETNTQQQINLPTKENESTIDGRYISVILLLLIMIIFMLWIKKRVTSTTSTNSSKNSFWLFKGSANTLSNLDINILQKKQIDNANSVLLLEFEGNKYLVLTGNSNLLLEKFGKTDLKSDSDFEKVFEKNREKLDNYLRIRQEEEKDDYRAKLERA